ncbi:MAG TPA: histidine kinase [Clostridiaceae bacterium]|nr:histidine kinase [Clostridiaceae bacterium]
MWEQQVLFRQMKLIKDIWVEGSVEAVQGKDTDLRWTSNIEEYAILREALCDEKKQEAYRKVINDVVEGVMHSMMVMFDGGSALSDEFSIDVINSETGESLLSYSALHEEFIDYIIDAEEEEEK